MKNLFYSTLFMLAMIVAALSFTSCGDDDEGIGDSSSLVGTWRADLVDEINDAFSDEFEELAYHQFKSDGTCISITVIKWKGDYADVMDDEVDIERGTYFVDGDKITAKFGKETETCTYKISGNKLTLTTTKGMIITTTYTRVSDSEVNKYLK